MFQLQRNAFSEHTCVSSFVFSAFLHWGLSIRSPCKTFFFYCPSPLSAPAQHLFYKTQEIIIIIIIISSSMSGVFQRVEYMLKYEFQRLKSAVKTFLFHANMLAEQQAWWNGQDGTWCSPWRRTQTPTMALFSLKCRIFSRCRRQCNFNDVHKKKQVRCSSPRSTKLRITQYIFTEVSCTRHYPKIGQKCRQHKKNYLRLSVNYSSRYTTSHDTHCCSLTSDVFCRELYPKSDKNVDNTDKKLFAPFSILQLPVHNFPRHSELLSHIGHGLHRTLPISFKNM